MTQATPFVIVTCDWSGSCQSARLVGRGARGRVRREPAWPMRALLITKQEMVVRRGGGGPLLTGGGYYTDLYCFILNLYGCLGGMWICNKLH